MLVIKVLITIPLLSIVIPNMFTVLFLDIFLNLCLLHELRLTHIIIFGCNFCSLFIYVATTGKNKFVDMHYEIRVSNFWLRIERHFYRVVVIFRWAHCHSMYKIAGLQIAILLLSTRLSRF